MNRDMSRQGENYRLYLQDIIERGAETSTLGSAMAKKRKPRRTQKQTNVFYIGRGAYDGEKIVNSINRHIPNFNSLSESKQKDIINRINMRVSEMNGSAMVKKPRAKAKPKSMSKTKIKKRRVLKK